LVGCKTEQGRSGINLFLMFIDNTLYLEKNDVHSTLTTWIYCAFWQMWSAEQRGWDEIYIHWPYRKSVLSYEDRRMFFREPNMYDWYFKQPKTNFRNPATAIWTWENWSDECPIPFMSQPLSVIKDYYKKNLHFNEETNKRGQAIKEKYKIDFQKTIGITWRGTDVYLDGRPRIPIAVYFRFIDEILEKNPDFRIVCTAEEERILDPLLIRYPQAFRIEEFYQSPFEGKHNPERISPMSGYERGLQPVLMVWLFSKCAHYIKNRSSTGAVASWLSDGRIVNIAHEETLSYLKMDDQVEIEGIKYPL
jgi:hypothetical protein